MVARRSRTVQLGMVLRLLGYPSVVEVGVEHLGDLAHCNGLDRLIDRLNIRRGIPIVDSVRRLKRSIAVACRSLSQLFLASFLGFEHVDVRRGRLA